AQRGRSRALHCPNGGGLGTMPAQIGKRIAGFRFRPPAGVIRWQPAARRYYCGRAENAALAHGHDTSVFSSTNFLSFSSLPVSSNEFVIVALPFSTLVIT